MNLCFYLLSGSELLAVLAAVSRHQGARQPDRGGGERESANNPRRVANRKNTSEKETEGKSDKESEK